MKARTNVKGVQVGAVGVLVAAAIALVWLAVSLSGPPSAPPAGQIELNGILTSRHLIRSGDNCSDYLYSKLSSGSQVVVQAANGNILGAGELKAGAATDGSCYLLWAVPNVQPDASQTYMLKAGCVEVAFAGADRYVSATLDGGCGSYAAGD